MLVYSSVDDNPGSPGPVWALAGSAPGTAANWQQTQDPVRGEAFLDASGQSAPVPLPIVEFIELSVKYLSPVQTVDSIGGEG